MSLPPKTFRQFSTLLNLPISVASSLGNAARLNQVGISTAQQFLNASLYELKRAFRSIAAAYWFMRLRGWEIDDFSRQRKSFSHSYVLPQKITVEQSAPILIKLVHQLTERLRQQGIKLKTYTLV
jgi:nucleotidyltransferase/DNA polymerase involved in DNA repair